MADIKVLYINADGLPQEHSVSADSVQMLSLKTATNELTDTRLGNLIGGADGSAEHTHNSVYFQESEHVSTSAGAGDAAKPIVLNASGLVDGSMVDLSGLSHGSLANLLVDDHTIYSLADGSRNYSAVVSYASHPAFTVDTQIVDKKYVDDITLTSEWYPNSALDYVIDNTAIPATEVLGAVYILSHDGGIPHANYDGASAGDIVEFNGTLWVATTPTTGTKNSVDDEPNTAYYLWGGASWVAKLLEATTASTGLVKVGVDVQIDPSAAGAGLGFAAGVLSTNVDGTSIETSADTLQVVANGINDTHIDFGIGANQVSGVDLPLADAGNYFTTDNTEAALQELGEAILNSGQTYTVGAGGVTIGDVVYISAANTVLPYSVLSQAHRGIGVALSTVAAAGTVKVLANDNRLNGLTIGGAPTVGDPIYWDGTQLTGTIVGVPGSHVWQAGVLVGANDMHIETKFVKKNA